MDEFDCLASNCVGFDRIKSGRGRGVLHGLSRSPVSTVEQLADCGDTGSLALRLQRQVRKFDDGRRCRLAGQLLDFYENLPAAAAVNAN